jgi:hypothetical protein
LAPGCSRLPRGFPSASGLDSACPRTAPWQQSPKIGGAQSAVNDGPWFWGSNRSRSRKSALCFQTEDRLRPTV